MTTSPQSTLARFYGRVDPTLFVVTVHAAGERSGCVVGFSTQASVSPPRLLVCISRTNHTHRIASLAETLLVHRLDADAHDLAELFGGETGDEVDKFARVEWRNGPGGAPLLERLATWIAGRVVERIHLGDHTGFLLEPIAGAVADADPLRFGDARAITPGHAP